MSEFFFAEYIYDISPLTSWTLHHYFHFYICIENSHNYHMNVRDKYTLLNYMLV